MIYAESCRLQLSALFEGLVEAFQGSSASKTGENCASSSPTGSAGLSGLACNWPSTIAFTILIRPDRTVAIENRSDLKMGECLISFAIDNIGQFLDWCSKQT